MNKFISHGNKLLLITTIAVGFGAFTSQLNRANAIVVDGCPDNDGSLGTGEQCVGQISHAFDHRACQTGRRADLTTCCDYIYNIYWCYDHNGTKVVLGVKGDLEGATPHANCVYINSYTEMCAASDSTPPGGTG